MVVKVCLNTGNSPSEKMWIQRKWRMTHCNHVRVMMSMGKAPELHFGSASPSSQLNIHRALGIAALLVAILTPTSGSSIARSVRWREPDPLLTLWTLEARSQWLSMSVLMGRELYLVIRRSFPRYRSSCRELLALIGAASITLRYQFASDMFEPCPLWEVRCKAL